MQQPEVSLIKPIKRKIPEFEFETPIAKKMGIQKEDVIEYVPLTYSDREKCKEKWSFGKEIGSGSYGSIREACSNSRCENVVKVVDISSKRTYEAFNRDYTFLKRLQNSGIVPKLEDYWTCDNIGFLVIERFTGDVARLITEEKDRFIIPSRILKKMQNIIKQLSDRRIIHGDLKPDQFLYKNGNVVLTDFGTALDYSKDVITKDTMLGWHYSRFACRAQRDFVYQYNLWNLELWFRWQEKITGKPYYVETPTKVYKLNKFDKVDNDIRMSLDSTCVIKPPPIL